jgi:hypothetical protein
MKTNQEARIQAALAELISYKNELQKRPNISATAEKHDVAQKTLSDHWRKYQSSFQLDRRPNAALSDQQEQALVSWLQLQARRGLHINYSVLKQYAERLRDTELPAKGLLLGKNWPTGFVKRHKSALKSIYGDHMDSRRQKAVNKEDIKEFFYRLELHIKENNIATENLYNFDEKGFLIGVSGRTRFITTAEIQPNQKRKRQSGNRENITAIIAVCADGSPLPTALIYKGLHHQEDWYNDVDPVDGTLFGCSETGWTNNKFGLQWIRFFDNCTAAKAAER